MPVNPLTIRATDGYELAATAFLLENVPEHVVLIVPATGVTQHVYRAFASFLSGEGLGALTWDWRGLGESRPIPLRGFEATMRD